MELEPPPVYLDYNATTPVHPLARDAMLPWLTQQWGNPSSDHWYGRQAAEAIAQARAQVAQLIGARAEQIIFTGGGTEADNLAICGPSVARRRLVISAVEHPAVAQPARALRAQGWSLVELPVDRRGLVDRDSATKRLHTPAGLVSVILAQNETGVIQPVTDLAAMARAAASDVLIHSDAAQAVGKIPVDVDALDVDLLTIVSHKIYGPAGIAALYIRSSEPLRPLARGGGQERGIRPGTEPVALIAGFGAACAVAQRDLLDEATRVSQLRDRLWARLRAAIPGIQWTGEGAPMLPNTLHVRIPEQHGATVLAAAQRHVAASTGSACHPSNDPPSGVLGAMGLSNEQARGALRLTLGRQTNAIDIDRAAHALVTAAQP